MSNKQAARLRRYKKMRDAFLIAIWRCQIQSPKCTTWSNEVHHSKGRIGDNLLDASTWFATCRACHEWIEHTGDGVKWAKENGFIKTRA